MFKLLWEAACASEDILARVRLLKDSDEEDYIIEVAVPTTQSWKERLTNAFYVLCGRQVFLGAMLLDADSVRRLKEVGDSVAKG